MKTLEEILGEFEDNPTIYVILAGTLLNGIMLKSMGRNVDENLFDLVKKELYKVLKKTITQAFQVGRDSMKEEIEYSTYFQIVKKIRQETKKEILEEVNKLNTKHPERESDEYDKGQEDFKNKVEDIIKGI